MVTRVLATDDVTVWHGDALDVLGQLDDASVDAVISDPPYGLSQPPDMAEVLSRWLAGDDYHHRGGGFMGNSWDAFVPGPAVWRETYRVLKPGGHALVFAGSRTQDLMGLALRLAGFELRDTLMWLYGSGMPKSLDVSKAIDKAAGATRTVIGTRPGRAADPATGRSDMPGKAVGVKQIGVDVDVTAPATPEAAQWDGWGTALKPAYEPILLVRRPLEGTVAANVLTHGTGAINIDGCRIEAGGTDRFGGGAKGSSGFVDGYDGDGWTPGHQAGRWPANVVLDEVAAAALDRQSGISRDGVAGPRSGGITAGSVFGGGGDTPFQPTVASYGGSGGASRFFYCAKASGEDRAGNPHPTVKPVELMRWLVRLVTPPGGTVLDPFVGSGSTLVAAVVEGRSGIGVDRELGYVEVACERLGRPLQPVLALDA